MTGASASRTGSREPSPSSTGLDPSGFDPSRGSLLERIYDEMDLCRNDGADDIAELLDNVASALRRFTTLAESLLDNGLDEPVADNGATVFDLWRTDARKLVELVIGARP